MCVFDDNMLSEVSTKNPVVDEGLTYNLLPELPGLGSDAGMDLLPTSTRVIAAKYAPRKRFWMFAALSTSLCALAILVNSTPFIIVLIIVAVALACCAYRIHVFDKKEYLRLVANDGWLYGIFIFASGDVVVRHMRGFPFCLQKVEHEFRGSTVTHASGNNSTSSLYIFYNDDMGMKCTRKIYVGGMTKKAVEIAHMIIEANPGENNTDWGLSSI